MTNAIDVEYSNGGGVAIPLPGGLISWPGPVAMPLDRPIIVGIRGADDFNDAGQFIAGPLTSWPVWATVVDLTATPRH